MKNKRFTAKDLLFAASIVAVFALLHVFLIGETQKTNNQIEKKKLALDLKHNELQQRIVLKQKFEAEDRIVNIASDSLGLIRSDNPYELLRVDKKEIKKIEKIIADKHDR